ncbi:MAG: pyridoxamine 5'-phosphate oxidase [Rhodospirillaceae bacterium]|nr:pyridoxamine 5'-phosphate oxidase [Rhodospirillaceae bacterium]|tara:strand:- start:5994 stop:6608 length:615 start_codon:yes stop_codon:yes gene_type:complete
MDVITDKTTLSDLYGKPSERAILKQLDYIDEHCAAFIKLSPFLIIGTMGKDGLGDVSPRGDAPGFVMVKDERTLLLPDRLGNNRTDTLSNIIENKGVGLLFLVPGMNETLRVNGYARITVDAKVLENLSAQGKPPRSALQVDVREAYLQCAKALIRSKLWDDNYKIERKSFPSLGQIIADQMGRSEEGNAADQSIKEGYRDKLY